MPPIDRTHYEIHRAICKQTHPSDPIHWILLLAHPNDTHCIWYHSVNENGHEGAYEMLIEPNKRFNSWAFAEKIFLGLIPVELGVVVSREACKVPPQNCQYWVAYVLMRLERVGLVQRGLYRRWIGQVSERWGDEGPGDLRY
jgi:hypothetical protein